MSAASKMGALLFLILLGGIGMRTMIDQSLQDAESGNLTANQSTAIGEVYGMSGEVFAALILLVGAAVVLAGLRSFARV